jgi:hypothetical protein
MGKYGANPAFVSRMEFISPQLLPETTEGVEKSILLGSLALHGMSVKRFSYLTKDTAQPSLCVVSPVKRKLSSLNF